MRRGQTALFPRTDSAAPTRCCEHPGCPEGADYRAPHSPGELDQFRWFCLEHVRAYNASWNYYAGMNEREIEREIRHDAVWQRPTWPLGARVGSLYGARIKGFGLFDLDEETGGKTEEKRRRPLSPQEEALLVFELQPPFTQAGLKARYKQLVKLHHPDSHGGDKEAEERLKIINRAYATLKAAYFP